MTPADEDGDENDSALFRRAMRGVSPLKPSPRAPSEQRSNRPRARLIRSRRQALLTDDITLSADLYEIQAGDELVFRRAGVPETALRRLRRGQYGVEAEIDLHGMNVAQASSQLQAFLREATSARLRCVRVIHGKGLGSGNRGPVLKNAVNALLRRSSTVLAFASARPAAGGTGAALVLLSRI